MSDSSYANLGKTIADRDREIRLREAHKAEAYDHIREALGMAAEVDPQEVVDTVRTLNDLGRQLREASRGIRSSNPVVQDAFTADRMEVRTFSTADWDTLKGKERRRD